MLRVPYPSPPPPNLPNLQQILRHQLSGRAMGQVPRVRMFDPRSDSTLKILSKYLKMTLQCTFEKQFTLYRPWINPWIRIRRFLAGSQDPSLKLFYVESWVSLLVIIIVILFHTYHCISIFVYVIIFLSALLYEIN